MSKRHLGSFNEDLQNNLHFWEQFVSNSELPHQLDMVNGFLFHWYARECLFNKNLIRIMTKVELKELFQKTAWPEVQKYWLKSPE